MYTRCPHCATIFRVTAEELRTTYGDIPCVTCAQPFNAIDSLSDDITTLIAAPIAATDASDTTVTTDEQSVPEADEEPTDSITVEPDEEAEDDAYTAAGEDREAEDLVESDDTQADDSSDEQYDDHPDDDIEPEAAFDADEPEPDEPEPDEPEPDEPEPDEPEPAIDEPPPDSMEFDAPEQTWTRFFISNDSPAPPESDHREPTLEAEPDHATPEAEHPVGNTSIDQPWASNETTGSFELQTADQDEWKRFLTEVDENEPLTPKDEEEETEKNIEIADPLSPNDAEPALVEPLTDQFTADNPSSEAEIPIIPPWLSDETADELPDTTPPEQRRGFRPSWPVISACAALALLVIGQLLHYNRDTLAAHPTYGAAIRQAYAFLGAPLYPDWPLDAFDVTGTEAITGRSSQNALDILANVVVNSRQPIGLPLIRVVLRDRWANPVATRVFTPDEYLRDFDATQTLVMPGTALAVEISVADPGAEALGYVIDVCLPRRKTGLECQIAKDPFQ